MFSMMTEKDYVVGTEPIIMRKTRSEVTTSRNLATSHRYLAISHRNLATSQRNLATSQRNLATSQRIPSTLFNMFTKSAVDL